MTTTPSVIKFRHQVDDHYTKRHAPISIEDALGVRKWLTRRFVFLLMYTEVNVQLGLMGFVKDVNIAMLKF